MGKRIRLGIIFSVDENWIGGTYYLLNLVSALCTLPSENQPIITILSKEKRDFKAAQKTGYPHLEYYNPFIYKRGLLEAGINKVIRFFVNKDVIDKRLSSKKVEILFPASNDPCFKKVPNRIYWIPDFQHLFYPEFFPEKEVIKRNGIINEIATGDNKLVLSSQAAKRDWNSLHLQTNCKIFVIPFAVTHPSIEDVNIEDLLKEFQIEKEYFIISNQFWRHKNHLIVFKAIALIKDLGLKCQFVFTGKEDDDRDPGYFQFLLSFAKEKNLFSNIKMLGLIDRRKQLKLMQNAKAVIQPSLFEGWSTVIEDGKSLAKMVIASDIPVHREQLNADGLFFDPHNEYDLVEKIEAVLVDENHRPSIEYKSAIKTFGQSFLNILNSIKNQ